jgi:oligopeptide/dipeptide ABC transporter ATP-binding protein
MQLRQCRVWRSADAPDAVLSPDPTRRLARNLVVGEIPSAINHRRECPFYSRCPIRLDGCLDHVPAMAAVGPAHDAACLRWRDTSEVLAAPE